MKFSLIEWQNIVAALRLAARSEHARRNSAHGQEAREAYVNAQRFNDYADRIEATKVGG